MKSSPDPPMTLGNAAAARVRLIVWYKACGHRVEPDPAEMATRYGAETSVLDWRYKRAEAYPRRGPRFDADHTHRSSRYFRKRIFTDHRFVPVTTIST